MIQYVHRKLIRWGNWVKAQQSGGKGYPSTSPLYKQIMFGTVVGVPVYDSVLPDELAMEGSAMNDQVIKLSIDNIKILRIYYVENGTAKEKARSLGISKAGLYNKLHDIQQLLSD